MSERILIAFTGSGGSGKTNLAGRLSTALDRSLEIPKFTVDHVSIGEYVREQAQQTLGRNAIVSNYRSEIIDHLNGNGVHKAFNPDVMDGLLFECISQSHGDVLLLDGYPRYKDQLETLYEIGIREDFYTRGAVITHVAEREAIRRLTKRTGDRHTNEKTARARLHMQQLALRDVVVDLIATQLPTIRIDTSYPRERTLVEAYDFVRPLLPENGRSKLKDVS